MSDTDGFLRDVLARTRTIAVVGASMNPARPSYDVARYLSLRGYRVIPVNPGHAGRTLFGETVIGDLSEAPQDVDMVDIFRRPEAVPAVVERALEVLPGLRTIWMQIGVTHAEAAARAEARGVDVIQDRCPKIDHRRLFGEPRTGGAAPGATPSRP